VGGGGYEGLFGISQLENFFLHSPAKQHTVPPTAPPFPAPKCHAHKCTTRTCDPRLYLYPGGPALTCRSKPVPNPSLLFQNMRCVRGISVTLSIPQGDSAGHGRCDQVGRPRVPIFILN
jgi:hypothetical protein